MFVHRYTPKLFFFRRRCSRSTTTSALREPCENYMKCVSVLKFDSLAPFVASDTILFRPIHPIAGLRCRCPLGFTGDYCETEIDLCYSKPCGAHGVCRSHEGGFTCQCLHDYTGEKGRSLHTSLSHILIEQRGGASTHRSLTF